MPAVTGLQINLALGTIVTAPPDLRKVTDRRAAAPIYKRADEVIKLMMVLRRMGGLTDKDTHWGGYKALTEADKSLNEENMSALAEAAYRKAKSATSGQPEIYDIRAAKYVASAEHAAIYEKRLLSNARKHLIKVLKEEHGGYTLAPK